ncbi:hypothetical protein [Natronobiforma cellulositropha]|uniref:hypothetical protein n=1 Tax=Natronobiforma cellulositropha TaxID=1679076 RepID=UPI0021D5EF08|nr:hypothetical protein [Natronobiforma cellulositropha]
MSAAEPLLSEPVVLAHAKRRLFPDCVGSSGADATGYAVTDTQFAADCWLEGEPIDPRTRSTLAPFNHVKLGSGYPDLVGVGTLESDVLGISRLGREPPLVAVEAKGHVSSGGVDTHRGIVQAYDRLDEANVAYLAAPATAVSETDRALARELNVGVLGVDTAGEVSVLESPRVVGNRSGGDGSWIRFQAGAQGVTERSFSLNHPKNYLGYPLAHDADGETDTLLAEYRVVNATAGARRGAALLGLLEDGPGGVRLTELGREVVRFALARHGSVETALEEFETWYRSRQRFVEQAPAWGELARRIVFAHPAVRTLVTELQCLADDGTRAPTLLEFVEYLHVLRPTFTVELFVRGDEDTRARVLRPDGSLRPDALADGTVYHAPTVFQLKTMCYHVGLLAERGREPHRLEPTADCWALCDPL